MDLRAGRLPVDQGGLSDVSAGRKGERCDGSGRLCSSTCTIWIMDRPLSVSSTIVCCETAQPDKFALKLLSIQWSERITNMGDMHLKLYSSRHD
eukprot:746885-Hanusia_phi.AAC.4